MIFKKILFAALTLTFSAVFPCTVFVKTAGGKTLVGNNEDSTEPVHYLWSCKADRDGNGVVYYGTADFGFLAQGGINDKGLVFDWLQVPPHSLTRNETKIEVTDWAKSLLHKIMRECSTVDEVRRIINAYDLSFLQWSQLIFVEKNGRTIIVEGDTIITNEERMAVCTNFRQSAVNSPNDIPCERYKRAQELISGSTEFSPSFFASVLDSVKQTGVWGGTQISQVYDLEEQKIYLYLFHNFREAVQLSVRELTDANDTILISDLFKDKKDYDAFTANCRQAQKLIAEFSENNKTDLKLKLEILSANPQTIIFRDALLEAAHTLLAQKKTEEAF